MSDKISEARLSPVAMDILSRLVKGTDDELKDQDVEERETLRIFSRERLIAIKGSELSDMGVPSGLREYFNHSFDPKQQPKIPPTTWKQIWMAVQSGSWVTIIGSPGIGKTDFGLRCLWEKRLSRPFWDADSFAYIDMAELATCLNPSMPDRDRGSALQTRFNGAAVVLLDDVGYANTEAVRFVIKRWIISAEKRRQTLIMTGNLTAANLAKYIGEAAFSRLARRPNQIFELVGRDMRKVLSTKP